MKSPEVAEARLSFSPTEFEVLQAAVSNYKRLPEAHIEAERLIESIQRDWRGMSIVDIRREARLRAANREPVVHYHGTVIAAATVTIPVRAALASEHPLLVSAAKVIKEGPPRHLLTSRDDDYWLLQGFDQSAVDAMRRDIPWEEGEPEEEPTEIPDFSYGTGLLMRGINVRTGKAALGAYNMPPIAGEAPRYDIGFVMDTTQTEQGVQVTIFERDGEEPSAVSSEMVTRLPHLRTID